MVVLVGNKQFTLSPTCVDPVTDPKESSKAPPVPVEDSDDEEEPQTPKGDCVPGRKLVNTDDTSIGDKQNLKGDYGLSTLFNGFTNSKLRMKERQTRNLMSFDAFWPCGYVSCHPSAVGVSVADSCVLVLVLSYM